MIHTLNRISAIFALSLVVVATAEAQIYSTNFSTLDGWTVTTDCESGYEWAADATPSTPIETNGTSNYPNFSPYFSEPASLNFNDGISIGGHTAGIKGASTCGSVASPSIDLSVAPRVPVLRFMAAISMETGCQWDKLTLNVRSVDVASGGPGAILFTDDCVYLTDVWSLREYELDSSWGLVQIEFVFNTIDSWTNEGPGPFIDDLEIIDRCGIDPMFACDDYLAFCFGDLTGSFCPCINHSVLGAGQGCRNSSGEGARLIPSGTPRVAHDTMRFQLEGAPASSFAFLVSGDNALPLGSPGEGIQDRDGLRCVGGNFLRHGARATDLADRSGFGTPGWGGTDNPVGGILGQYGFVHGQTRYFQVFVRDDVSAVCGTGLNRSNGVKVSIQ